MNLFSISQLAQFSGIKPHTIRIWEQRYNALNPNRSNGNTRYYDNFQMRRLLNIVSLLDLGYKVSELCRMPDNKLFDLLQELPRNVAENEHYEYFISQLVAAGMSYDEAHFEKIFSHCILQLGLKGTYEKVIPFMFNRVGIMWAADALLPTHEHFISNIVKQKLYTAIDALPPPSPTGSSWLLFLPENEFHEISLLLSHYLIRFSGRKSIYLGANVPFQSLIHAINDVKPQNILLFLMHYDLPEDTREFIKSLQAAFKKKIYIAGNEKLIGQIETNKKLIWLRSLKDLEQHLTMELFK